MDRTNLDVKIVIDAQNNIFFISVDGSNVRGRFGTLSLATKAKALTTPVTDKNGNDDPPGHDAGDDHGQDADDLEDFDEDLNDDHPNASFSLTLLSGEAVTGSLTYGHGVQLGDFTLGGVTYFFRAPQESSENHLANISTRGLSARVKASSLAASLLPVDRSSSWSGRWVHPSRPRESLPCWKTPC